jgi:hypothetical protein
MRKLRDIEYRDEDVVETIQFEILRVTHFEEFKMEILLANAWKRKIEIYDMFSSPSGSLIRNITNISDRFVTLSSCSFGSLLFPHVRVSGPNLLIHYFNFVKSVGLICSFQLIVSN